MHSCEPSRCNSVFFSYRKPEKSAVKARLVESCHTCFLAWKRNPPKLTSAKANCRILLAFILCIQAVFTTKKFVHVGWFVQTNKDW